MEINQIYNFLVIDDEENMRHMLTAMLKKYEYDVDTAPDGQLALDRLKDQYYDFILCDIKMPNMSGMAFLKAARSLLDQTTIIMMSAYGNIDTAYVQALYNDDDVFIKVMQDNQLTKEEA